MIYKLSLLDQFRLCGSRRRKRSVSWEPERAPKSTESHLAETRLAAEGRGCLRCYVTLRYVRAVTLRTWYARRRGATTSSQYEEPDAPRSRQPLTTCFVRPMLGLFLFAGRHARYVGYIRSVSTPLVLSGQLEALRRRA